MNDLPETVRQRTSSELKWLLNERAAVLGQLGKAQTRAESLERAACRHEQMLANAVLLRDGALREAAEKRRSLQALDTAIHLVNSRARPDAAGCVVPWKGKYGQRGGLSDFLKESLRVSAPTSISGADLTRLAKAHFNLSFQTAEEKLSFKDTVRKALKRIVQRDGLAERLPMTFAKQQCVLYRWKGPTSLASLRALVKAEHGTECETAENSTRPQVAAQ